MSKYTRAELRSMAQRTLEAIKNGNPSGLLIVHLSAMTARITPEDAMKRIKAYAEAETA